MPTVTKTTNHTTIEQLTYNALHAAGEMCRERCKEEPDLLDAIADGIHRFLCDGDVYEQVVRTLIETDPELIGRCLASVDEDVSRKVIALVLE